MRPEYRPLLVVQRELYAIPRGRGRFIEYLRTMKGASGTDIELPLGAMNPMAREHVPARLDGWLGVDADGEAARAVAAVDLPDALRGLRSCLVLADDAKGGWTNRHAADFADRFESGALLKRHWAVGLLWSSEEPSAREAREAALAAVHRAVLVRERGPARTLGEMLEQEGLAMARAGRETPALSASELREVRRVVEPRCGASDRPTLIACLYGDAAAAALGYEPFGIPSYGGLALALADAL